MSDILKTMRISAAGMQTQGVRLRVIAENIANANSTQTPEGGPYRRRQVVFQAAYEPSLYDRRLPYDLPLLPAPTPEDEAWVRQQLRKFEPLSGGSP